MATPITKAIATDRHAQKRGTARGLRLPYLYGGPYSARDIHDFKVCLGHIVEKEWRLDEGLARGDWTVAKCAMHERVDCGHVAAEGCKGASPGVHPVVAGLYAAGHDACVVQPGVRVVDQRVVLHVERGDALVRGRQAYATAFKKLYAGLGVAPGALGAGYCYDGLFEPTFVMRAARILGPEALVRRFAVYFLVFGKPKVVGLRLVRLRDGRLHCEYHGSGEMSKRDILWELVFGGDLDSAIGAGGLGDVSSAGLTDGETLQLRALVAKLPGVAPAVANRVQLVRQVAGVGPGLSGHYGSWEEVNDEAKVTFAMGHRRAALQAWFEERDLKLDEVTLSEVVFATCSGANLNNFADYRARNAVMALLGDSVVRTHVSARVIAARGLKSQVSDLLMSASNVAMAAAMVRSGFRHCCDVTGFTLHGKANADMYEAVVGVLMWYNSYELAVKFVNVTLEVPVLSEEPVVVRSEHVGGRVGAAVTEEDVALVQRIRAAGILD